MLSVTRETSSAVALSSSPRQLLQYGKWGLAVRNATISARNLFTTSSPSHCRNVHGKITPPVILSESAGREPETKLCEKEDLLSAASKVRTVDTSPTYTVIRKAKFWNRQRNLLRIRPECFWPIITVCRQRKSKHSWPEQTSFQEFDLTSFRF